VPDAHRVRARRIRCRPNSIRVAAPHARRRVRPTRPGTRWPARPAAATRRGPARERLQAAPSPAARPGVPADPAAPIVPAAPTGGPRRPGGPGGPGGPGSGGGGSNPGGSADDHRRRRRIGLAAKIVAALASLAVLFYSGMAWSIADSANSNADRLSGLKPNKIDKNPKDSDGKAQNILLVGNDSRVGYTAKELAEVATGPDGGGFNTDTIMLLHVPSDGSEATLVSIPRDSYVAIPGFKAAKINGAYADGACYPPGAHTPQCGDTLTKAQQTAGAKKLMETVGTLSGLHIDHYVEVSLLGFYNISNVLGGVNICLKENVDDSWTGLKLSAGHHKIKGTQALQFVRQRHNFPDAAGDIDRIYRQQAFLGSAVKQVLSAGTILNPFKAKKFVETVSKSLTIDDDLDLVKLASQLRNIAAGKVIFTTMPTAGPAEGTDSDALAVNTTAVLTYFNKVAGNDTGKKAPAKSSTPKSKAPAKQMVSPAQVSVKVLNGSGIKGQAGSTAEQLGALGYQVTGSGDADRLDYSKSLIRYAPDDIAKANTLAASVAGAQLVEDQSTGASLTLIVGRNFNGVKSPASTTASSSAAGTPSTPASGGGSTKSEQRTASDDSCVY
jgi:LCP family protein required for cell wall assembly